MSRRSRRRNRVLAWAAIATGVAASAVMIGQGQGEAIPTQTVLVASRDIPRGTALSPSDAEAIAAPAGWTVGGLERDPASLEGRRTVAPLSQGDLITVAATGGPTAVAPLSAGQRAVPVPISAAGGSAALLEPGARVDVVASRGEGPMGKTSVVVWNVEVLAVPAPGPDGYVPDTAAVLLRATPRDALRITSALNFARDVRLVVRPTADVPATPRPGTGAPAGRAFARVRRG